MADNKPAIKLEFGTSSAFLNALIRYRDAMGFRSNARATEAAVRETLIRGGYLKDARV